MEGYGRSDKKRDIVCDIANGADDLAAATGHIMQTRGIRNFLTYGISSGALRAALFAERHPERGAAAPNCAPLRCESRGPGYAGPIRARPRPA